MGKSSLAAIQGSSQESEEAEKPNWGEEQKIPKSKKEKQVANNIKMEKKIDRKGKKGKTLQ